MYESDLTCTYYFRFLLAQSLCSACRECYTVKQLPFTAVNMNKTNIVEHSTSTGERDAGARGFQTPKFLKAALKANSRKGVLSPQKHHTQVLR